MSDDNLTPEEKERQNQRAKRERVRRLFSTVVEIRHDAVEVLKETWDYNKPSFRVEELANFPHANCCIMAARRDAQKEIIDWLLAI
jgi:hypothetical protein